MTKNLIVFLFLLKTCVVWGQKNVTHQNVLWYALFTTIDINKKWYFQHEFQERHFIRPFKQHQFVVRSHIHRFLGDSGWEVSAGMCLFLQSSNDPTVPTSLTIPELRPHVEFAYAQKLPLISFDHRYRVEARFFHNTNSTKTELEDGYTFGNYRFRYRIQATMRLLKITGNNYLKVKVSNEIHINAGRNITKNVFDQNRVFAGISLDLSPSTILEVGYMNWFQQKNNGNFYNRDILRLTAFYKLFSRKSS